MLIPSEEIGRAWVFSRVLQTVTPPVTSGRRNNEGKKACPTKSFRLAVLSRKTSPGPVAHSWVQNIYLKSPMPGEPGPVWYHILLCHCLRSVTWSERCCSRSYGVVSGCCQLIYTGNSWFCPGKSQNSSVLCNCFKSLFNLHSQILQNDYHSYLFKHATLRELLCLG